MAQSMYNMLFAQLQCLQIMKHMALLEESAFYENMTAPHAAQSIDATRHELEKLKELRDLLIRVENESRKDTSPRPAVGNTGQSHASPAAPEALSEENGRSLWGRDDVREENNGPPSSPSASETKGHIVNSAKNESIFQEDADKSSGDAPIDVREEKESKLQEAGNIVSEMTASKVENGKDAGRISASLASEDASSREWLSTAAERHVSFQLHMQAMKSRVRARWRRMKELRSEGSSK